MKRWLLTTMLVSLMLASPALAQDEILANRTSRDNPVEIGERGRLGPLAIGVEEVLDFTADRPREARNLDFLDEIPDDTHFIVVRAYVELVDRPSDGEVYHLRGGPYPRFTAVGQGSNVTIDEFVSCAFFDTEKYQGVANAPDLFQGGSTVITTCFIVPEDDLDTLVMYADDSNEALDEELWMALTESNEGTPVATPRS